jgi:hypothetical protein
MPASRVTQEFFGVGGLWQGYCFFRVMQADFLAQAWFVATADGTRPEFRGAASLTFPSGQGLSSSHRHSVAHQLAACGERCPSDRQGTRSKEYIMTIGQAARAIA